MTEDGFRGGGIVVMGGKWCQYGGGEALIDTQQKKYKIKIEENFQRRVAHSGSQRGEKDRI